MADKLNKHIDDLLKKSIQTKALDEPSINFTTNVMSEVNALAKNKISIYKPLISKTAWFFIGTTVLGIIIYAVLGIDFSESNWMSTWIQDLNATNVNFLLVFKYTFFNNNFL
jgi:hypothetical protein